MQPADTPEVLKSAPLARTNREDSAHAPEQIMQTHTHASDLSDAEINNEMLSIQSALATAPFQPCVLTSRLRSLLDERMNRGGADDE